MNSVEKQHREMVTKLAKPGADIKKEMSGEKWNSLLEAVTVMVQAGNHLDQMKKLAVYNKPGIPHNATPKRVPNMTDEQYHLLHMAIGIAGEAAELLEATVNYCLSNKWDNEHITEELGDLEFYLEGFRQGPGMFREEPLAHNLNKLAVRYAGYKYTDTAAQERADKS